VEIEKWQQVSSGGTHTCGIRNGKLFCWGENFSCGIRNIDASLNAGDIYCWGMNTYGQLGVGDNDLRSIPTQIIAKDAQDNVLKWKSVSLGSTHTCAITSNDELYCWGRGFQGMLGINSVDDRNEPVMVNLPDVYKVSLGTNFTCAIASSNKKLYCWGNNNHKQLGCDNNSNLYEIIPKVLTDEFNKNWSEVTLGLNHACASKNGNDGFKLYCWGSNTDGQLGLNAYDNNDFALSTEGNFIFAESDNTINKWHSISARQNSTCGVIEDSSNNLKLNCWGENDKGQLGLGFSGAAFSYVPLNVIDVSNDSFPSMGGTESEKHTCAIIDSKLYCWGSYAQGQLGVGDLNSRDEKAPILVE
jgi:alpha-tubulin suppressor-like RCC1 family protein